MIAGYFWNEYTATSRVEPIFAHVNMHGFGWKFLAPSSSCARNSAMKIAERSSLKILPNPNTIISHTWPRHSTWSSTGPAGHVLSPSVEASKFPRSRIDSRPVYPEMPVRWRPPGDLPWVPGSVPEVTVRQFRGLYDATYRYQFSLTNVCYMKNLECYDDQC